MNVAIRGTLRMVGALSLAALTHGQNSLDKWRADHLAPEKNRYEGTVPDLVAGERIELFSFIRRPVTFETSSRLQVNYYQPSGKQVVVVARALTAQYRMESIPQTGTGLLRLSPWPTSFQLDKLQIKPSDLGLVGFVTGDGKVPPPGIPEVVPVDFGPEPGNTKTYLASFVPNFRVAALQWTLTDASNAVVNPGKPPKQGGAIEKHPFTIEIPEPPASSNPYRLTVTAVPLSSGSTTSIQVDFIEPPAGKP
jgi:hypothetical protein